MRNRYSNAMELAAKSMVADRSGGIEYRSPRLIAKLYLHAGKHERALDYLESAYQEKDPQLVNIVDPAGEALIPNRASRESSALAHLRSHP